MTSRIQFLDTCRFLAVLLVSFGHIILVGATNDDTLSRFFGEVTKGNYPILSHFNGIFLNINYFLGAAGTGVCLFFLITGYIIPKTYFKYSQYHFLVARFFRIIPPALLTMIVVQLFLSVFFANSFKIYDIFINFIMFLTKNSFATNVPQIEQAVTLHSFEIFWTLSIEIIFYLLVATLNIKKINSLTSLSLMQFLMMLFFARTGMLAFLFLAFILFGSIFLFLEIKITEDKAKIRLSDSLLIALSSLLFLYLVNTANIYPIKTFIFSLLIFLLIYAFHKKVLLPQMILKIINFVANISYSFYLIHLPIGMGTALFLKLHFQITNPYIQVLLAYCVCLSISYSCYILFEKPSIKFGKFLVRKLE